MLYLIGSISYTLASASALLAACHEVGDELVHSSWIGRLTLDLLSQVRLRPSGGHGTRIIEVPVELPGVGHSLPAVGGILTSLTCFDPSPKSLWSFWVVWGRVSPHLVRGTVQCDPRTLDWPILSAATWVEVI